MLDLPYWRKDDVTFIRELTRAGTPFLIIGGAAVCAHQCRDISDVDDLDILIDANIRSAAAVAKCAIPYGYNLDETHLGRLTRPSCQFQMKHVPLYLEILTPRLDQSFSDILQRSVDGMLDCVPVKYASIRDLIEMKAKLPEDKHKTDVARLSRLVL